MSSRFKMISKKEGRLKEYKTFSIVEILLLIMIAVFSFISTSGFLIVGLITIYGLIQITKITMFVIAEKPEEPIKEVKKVSK